MLPTRHPGPDLAAQRYRHRIIDWKSLVVVVAMALANSAAFQGTRGLYETTEGRYAECARETQLNGDWDDPILDGQPHWTKPPLTYAAIMAGTKLFGENPWGVRAYLVAALALATAAVWWTGVSIWGPAAGRWAGLVFATSPAIAVAAHAVSTDMLVTLWSALALAAYWHGRAARSRWSALGTWIFAGLGALTKGPPALLVPLATLASAGIFLHRSRAWRPPRWTTALGIVLFLAIGCGWFAVEAFKHPGLLVYWFGQELIARNITAGFDRNPGVAFVFTAYVPVLLLGTGPWLAFVLVRWRKSFESWPGLRPIPRTWNGAARWALLTGIAVPFLAFACSRSRLAAYLTPLFVPLALLLGRGLDLLIARGQINARTVHRMALGLLVLIATLKALAALPESASDMTRLSNRLKPLLARDPAIRLVAVGHRPLHGLKFHLNRDVELLAPEFLATELRRAPPANAHALFLVRTKQWTKLAPDLGSEIHVDELGPHWIGVRPNANSATTERPAAPNVFRTNAP